MYASLSFGIQSRASRCAGEQAAIDVSSSGFRPFTCVWLPQESDDVLPRHRWKPSRKSSMNTGFEIAKKVSRLSCREARRSRS